VQPGHPPPPPDSALHIATGTCYVIFAYDVGFSIDLTACEQHLTALTHRATIKHKHRAPAYFEYRPAPLQVIQEAEPLPLGSYYSHPGVEMVIYDFGAISLTYRIPLHGPFAALLALHNDLYANARLRQKAHRHVTQLVTALAGTVVRPHMADMVEDYVIFQIDAFTMPYQAETLTRQYAQDIAQLLRGGSQTLSTQEVHDALLCQIAFGLDDVAIIDWNAAFLSDREAEDVRAVLEFANVELLEMRYLDEQLDDALDQAYEALSKHNWHGFHLPGTSRADLRRIAQMQVDSAILFEGVNNALKLLGDQYLARVYRLASQRFHLEEWDASILRKLQILEGIYEKIADRAASRRLEILEWIVIALIAVSIILPFFANLPWH
jgi:hypothetical protein